MGWRFQVPYLLSLNLQVIVPDMLGYGQTSAPDPPSEYTLKKMSAHIANIINEVTDKPVILGGHDWGAFLAWRVAMYHPKLLRAIFSFCIPFFPPLPFVVSLEQFVEQFPAFRYQLQLAGPDAEIIAGKSEAHVRGFLSSMFGGVTPEGLPGFDVSTGIIEDRLEKISGSPLVTEDIMDYYGEYCRSPTASFRTMLMPAFVVKEYSRTGLHGPMNWYRTRSINAKDELPLAKDASTFKFQVPALLVMAGQDPALPISLADGQEQYFAAGLTKEVVPEASHWVLIHCPEESNKCIGEFVKKVLE
jgi:soluble epoxide hydrolase/lipid-phosphate phosphatase